MGDYTRISKTERVKLATFLEMKLSIDDISKRLNRHRSTIYRELNRNGKDKKYRWSTAHAKAKRRLALKLKKKIEKDPNLKAYVLRRLNLGWSPEQISGRLKSEKRSYYVCHESIYRYVFSEPKKALHTLLQSQKRKRGRSAGRTKKSCRYADITLIDNRPESIAARKELGHWEGDTIFFKGIKKKSITTLVERKSRYILLHKNESITSQPVIGAIKDFITKCPKKLWRSITFDQGSEFANYREILRNSKCQVYFCHPHSPWEKGSVENANLRIRRYLPKCYNIRNVSQSLLEELVKQLNDMPRKCLGYQTPKEALRSEFTDFCRTGL